MQYSLFDGVGNPNLNDNGIVESPKKNDYSNIVSIAADGKTRAVVGGQEGVNGYEYKGGQFLPSTMALPGQWQANGRWEYPKKQLIAPGQMGEQPTPFSHSIFQSIHSWCVSENNQLTLRSGIKDGQGIPLTLETIMSPVGHDGQGRKLSTVGELIEGYNNGLRWFETAEELAVPVEEKGNAQEKYNDQDATFHYTTGNTGMRAGGSFTTDKTRWMLFNLVDAERMDRENLMPYGATKRGIFVGSESGEKLRQAAKPVTPQTPTIAVQIADAKELSETNTEHNTSDAGAELLYNKRNRVQRVTWDDIKDKNATLRLKEVNKHKVYPKPDYQEISENGPHTVRDMNVMIAHIVKQCYDAISTSPQVRGIPDDLQLQKYIQTVNHYMDGVMQWANDNEATKNWITKIAQSAKTSSSAMGGMRVSVMDFIEKKDVSLLKSVYPDDWKHHRDEIRLIGGNKVLAALQPNTSEAIKALKDIKLGWPSQIESWQKRGFQVVPGTDIDFDVHQKATYIAIYTSLKNKNRPIEIKRFDEGEFDPTELPVASVAQAYIDNRKLDFEGKFIVLNKSNTLISICESEDAAIEQARLQTKRERTTIEKANRVSVSQAERIGPAYRNIDEDISSEKLMASFNLKGVNFGNWMQGDSNVHERQLNLNHAYDSLMDLASIINVEPHMLGMHAKLGLAIGAQGTGAYAGHFVPGVNEINITRVNGAGVVAHEFGHALDHFIAVAAGLERNSEPFLSHHASHSYSRAKHVIENGKSKLIEETIDSQDVPEEMFLKYKSLVSTMNKRTMTDDELLKSRDSVDMRTNKNVSSWLSHIKREFNSAGVDMSKFDVLEKQILDKDYGGEVALVGKKHYFFPVVSNLRDLYKESTGRLYALDTLDGLQHNLSSLDYSRRKPATTELDRSITTTSHFAANAYALDKEKKGKTYWSLDLEKFARCFETYVHDSLAEQGRSNTYLCGFNYEGRGYPQGEERKAINQAMDSVVKGISRFVHSQHKMLSCTELMDEPEMSHQTNYDKIKDNGVSR